MKLRAVLKWTGASLCALVFVAWFASRWFDAGVMHTRSPQTHFVEGVNGRTEFGWVDAGVVPVIYPEGWTSWFARLPARGIGWRWLPQRLSKSGPTREEHIAIPAYMPFAVIAGLTTWLFYRDRARMRWVNMGRCATCSYDLSGLMSGAACPECGRAAP